jgi:deoxyadenosine/deoxycytidine kinase
VEVRQALANPGIYVAVTGAIAAGASTLAATLYEQLGWRRFEEASPHQHNAFFVDAGRDFPRWGLHSQLHFATASAERHVRLRETLLNWNKGDLPIIEERTPFEHQEAYIRAYRRLGLIHSREADLLDRVMAILSGTYVIPDLLIYRCARHAEMAARIQDRQRPGEASVAPHVLETIENAFQEMVNGWTRSPVLFVYPETDLLDPVQAKRLAAQVRALVFEGK